MIRFPLECVGIPGDRFFYIDESPHYDAVWVIEDVGWLIIVGVRVMKHITKPGSSMAQEELSVSQECVM